MLRIDTENGAERRTYFVGNTELVITATGNRIWRRQIAGVAIAKVYPRTQVHQVAYLHRDHLGSVEAMSDEAGDTAGLRLSYGPYGNRRAADPWDFPEPGTFFQWTLEGFTGHEQIGAGGVVHMGGRLYDPRLGRFLQADPFVQFPESSQGLNRYSYVLNNPLRYTDSSGYGIDGDDIKLVAAIVISVYTGNMAAAADSFWTGLAWAVGGGYVSGYVATGSTDGAKQGAFTAALFYGTGQMFPGAEEGAQGADYWKSELAASTAYGVAGGVVAELQNGDFGYGFLSAGLSRLPSASISRNVSDPVGGTVISALVGGSISEATGGKFANGAATAAMSYAFGSMARNDGGSFRKALSVIGDVAGKIWNLPNTAIGAAIGGVGHVVGEIGQAFGFWSREPTIGFGNNALEFRNNPFTGTATALGNTIIYRGGTYSPDALSPHTGKTLGYEEMQHTYQGQALGPLYLPAHIGFGVGAMFSSRRFNNQGWHSPFNVLEKCPHKGSSSAWGC